MAKEVLECSFCGRKKPETQLLIAGIDAHICDKCIDRFKDRGYIVMLNSWFD